MHFFPFGNQYPEQPKIRWIDLFLGLVLCQLAGELLVLGLFLSLDDEQFRAPFMRVVTNILISLLVVTIVFGLARWRNVSLAELGFRPIAFRWILIALLYGTVVHFLWVRGLVWIVTPQAGLPLLEEVTLSTVGRALIINLFVGFNEELLYRGWIYGALRMRWGVPASVLLSSLLFGLGHYGSIYAIMTTFIGGIFYALLYEWSRSLWAPILAHVIWNVIVISGLYALIIHTVGF